MADPDAVTKPGEDSDDLESAYRRALEAIETAETEVGRVFSELSTPVDVDSEDSAPPAVVQIEAATGGDPAPEVDGRSARRRTSPLAVLEAALFVGGTELTTKRLVRMFNGEFDANRIGRFVEQLNERYARDGRPYEITFGEGGYRLALRSEFEDVRNRVFGLGPREVRLSQPALEMLALVAYHQPIADATVAEHGGRSGTAMLRQLVRRELVEVDRDEESAEVRYRTTPRFLEVFGITEVAELPRAVELELK